MDKHELMIIADYSQDANFTLKELCEICRVSSQLIDDLVEYQIILPKPLTHDQWIFNLTELKRIQTALRLQRDLEVNLAGVALVLDLLDELHSLREQSALLEKHFLRRK